MQGLTKLAHADWSRDPRKRWAVTATREAVGWRIEPPQLVGDAIAFQNSLWDAATCGAVLAGFDFPIGVPIAYGVQTGFEKFTDLLHALCQPAWNSFYQVATAPDQISSRRPFYPEVPRKGVSRASLLEGHGVTNFESLLRVCEKSTNERPQACSMFWTLGGNQVGKAALDGWKTIIIPLVERGARIWPFEGTIASLVSPGCLILAETYPTEAYRHIGISFRKRSKTRQVDRVAQSSAILGWAAKHRVTFSSDCHRQIEEGFGADRTGEDRFDALAGLLGLIEVADQRRPEGCPFDEDILNWEGWIIGQASSNLPADPRITLHSASS